MSRNQRIKDSLRSAGISQEKLAEHLGISQAAVGKQLNKDDDIDSLQFMRAVAELTGQSIDWVIYGKEKPELEEVRGSHGKTTTLNRGEFYQELVEANSDYTLIPKSLMKGDVYRIVLKSELEEMNKTREKLIESKDKSISLLERRIDELERHLAAVPQGVKK
jgi:transcriptional regulator with XRE-family HTH domain